MRPGCSEWLPPPLNVPFKVVAGESGNQLDQVGFQGLERGREGEPGEEGWSVEMLVLPGTAQL